MAFPYDLDVTFDDGTRGDFDGETDTVDQLDFPRYNELARIAQNDMIPFNGAFAMRLSLTGGTAEAFVNQTFAIALAARHHFRFHFYMSPDFVGTATDIFNIFEVLAMATVEGSFGLRANTDGTVDFGVGEVAPTVFSSFVVEPGAHYAIEIDLTVDDGGSNDGTINIFITKDGDIRQTTAALSITGLDQLAITQFRLGVQNHLGTTTGTILISDFISDSERIDTSNRFANTIDLTQTRHLFVGPGAVDYVRLMTSTAGHIVSLYDTDEAIARSSTFVGEAAVDLSPVLDTVMQFQKGCYAVLTGTNPRANIHLIDDVRRHAGFGPRYYSPSGVKKLGRIAGP